MSETISFFVPGEPRGQPRPRAFARRMGNRYVARVYDAGTAEGWKSAIAAVADQYRRQGGPWYQPVHLAITFSLPRPKRHYIRNEVARGLRPDAPHYCTVKPDCDNAAKAVMDALTQLGHWWHDDAQIVGLNVTKLYANDSPGAAIVITFRADEEQLIIP